MEWNPSPLFHRCPKCGKAYQFESHAVACCPGKPMDPLTRYNDEYKQAQRDRIAELEYELECARVKAKEWEAQYFEMQDSEYGLRVELAAIKNDVKRALMFLNENVPWAAVGILHDILDREDGCGKM